MRLGNLGWGAAAAVLVVGVVAVPAVANTVVYKDAHHDARRYAGSALTTKDPKGTRVRGAAVDIRSLALDDTGKMIDVTLTVGDLPAASQPTLTTTATTQAAVYFRRSGTKPQFSVSINLDHPAQSIGVSTGGVADLTGQVRHVVVTPGRHGTVTFQVPAWTMHSPKKVSAAAVLLRLKVTTTTTTTTATPTPVPTTTDPATTPSTTAPSTTAPATPTVQTKEHTHLSYVIDGTGGRIDLAAASLGGLRWTSAAHPGS